MISIWLPGENGIDVVTGEPKGGIDIVTRNQMIVTDEDGYDTDYTMYAVIELPDSSEWFDYVKHNANKGRGIPNSIISGYVFVLGDKEIYNPNDDEIEFDHECSTKAEALDWFDSYIGFDEEF